jgi:ASC-1-like (ASCH) protein
MNKHNLTLASTPFHAIASGEKTIESRLYDDKRKKIKVGDVITFTNGDEPYQTLKVCVTALLYEASFADLFSRYGPIKFGGPNNESLLMQIHEFYSESDEKINGVIGIVFVLN